SMDITPDGNIIIWEESFCFPLEVRFLHQEPLHSLGTLAHSTGSNEAALNLKSTTMNLAFLEVKYDATVFLNHVVRSKWTLRGPWRSRGRGAILGAVLCRSSPRRARDRLRANLL